MNLGNIRANARREASDRQPIGTARRRSRSGGMAPAGRGFSLVSSALSRRAAICEDAYRGTADKRSETMSGRASATA